MKMRWAISIAQHSSIYRLHRVKIEASGVTVTACVVTRSVTGGHRHKDAFGQQESATIVAMAISAHWYRENANACAWRAEQSRDPLVKAAYQEIVRAWLLLAVCLEESVRQPSRKARTEEPALAA
jgi:hypothetical protein